MLRSVFKDRLDVGQAEINELRKRVAELERRSLDYVGVWDESKAPYRPGEIVTDKGTIWFCKRATSTRPAGDDWQLMVKNSR
jgi:hypothetical protein